MANSHAGSRTRTRNPFTLIARTVEWFDSRGVYVPGEDSRSLSPWRDFGWIIIAWLVTVAAFIVLFAFAT
ncbi:MAG TPA: hypothetical protein VG247_16245 [Pseudonocardiaceae bacterium]|jgi:hypothetical protein|nr:hypothetical protein [Pseudonocardiaceae bacterium]